MYLFPSEQENEIRLALRRQQERSEGFRKLYAMRAGIEASNAELKQTTGLGRLRVRGLRAVRFAVTMKIVGVNIRRTTAVKIQGNGIKGPNPEDDDSILSLFRLLNSVICHETIRYMTILEENLNFNPNVVLPAGSSI